MPGDAQGVTVPLSLFGGLVTELSAPDLPEGLSPDNQDVVFLPGSVSSRPGLHKVYSSAISGNVTIVYQKTYVQPNGNPINLILDSAGNLWKEDVINAPGTLTSLGNVPAGSYAQSCSAFGREYLAISDAVHGVGIPLQFDGTNLDRVTQDGPGAAPVLTNFQPGSATIQGAGAPVTVNIVASPNGIVWGGTAFVINTVTHFNQVYYTYFTVTTTTPHGASVGDRVTIAGSSSTPSVNGTSTVATVPSSTTFTVSAQVLKSVASNGGNGTVGETSSSGASLTRSGNVVTAATSAAHGFQVGWQVQISGIANTSIGGGIAAISRDGNGIVTVTTTTAHGLPTGAQIAITGVTNPDTSYNGTFTVSEVVSSTQFQYSQAGTVTTSGAGTGNVQDIWNTTAYIQSVPTTTSFTYQQLGPNDSTTLTGTATILGQVSAGIHQCVVMFLTRQGYLTAPSVPVQFDANGAQQIGVSSLPIGPANVVARVLAFTGVGGANYFTLLTTPLAAGQVVGSSLVINDNVSTNVIIDFADNTLFGGTAIDIPGRNQFAQVVLGPCAGFFGYASRLFSWGEYNKIQNFVNMGFDGGFVSPIGTVNTSGTAVTFASGQDFTGWGTGGGFEIIINGATYIVATVNSNTSLTLTTSAGTQTGVPYQGLIAVGPPLGWTSTGSTGGTPFLILAATVPGGFAWKMTSAGGVKDCLIQQPAFQDVNGIAILQGSQKYIARINVLATSGITTGNLVLEFFSATVGSLATASLPAATLPTAAQFVQATFSAALPATVPNDTVLRIYQQSVTSGKTITIDEPEIIPALKPYLDNIARGSYVNAPEQFDGVTGTIGPATDSSPLRCMFEFRDVLYMDTARGRHQTIDNATGEPGTWSVRELSQSVGALSLKSSDTGILGTGDSAEQFEFTASRGGAYIFWGGEMVKISQEIQNKWDAINFNAKQTVWIKNDPTTRRCYFGLPLGTATAPNVIAVLDYRELNTPEAIASTGPFRQSYSGRMIATELARKWTIWNIASNSAEILTLPNNVQTVTFSAGNGQTPGTANGFGNIYYLDAAKLTDDDYGQIVPYWTTYFFVSNDQEQALQLDSHRKVATYFSAFMTGVGQTSITPLSDTLANAYTALPLYPLSTSQNHDLEWNINVDGERIALRIGSIPLNGQTDNSFNLQKLSLTLKKHPWSALRGAF